VADCTFVAAKDKRFPLPRLMPPRAVRFSALRSTHTPNQKPDNKITQSDRNRSGHEVWEHIAIHCAVSHPLHPQ
jgi:hypothetical protein